MTPASLLIQARADGVTLRLDPPDRLKLTGDPAAVSRWAPILRPHKGALVAMLTADLAGIEEAQAERAAILEADGGLARPRAQAVAELAAKFFSHHWACSECRTGTHVGSMRHRPCPADAELWRRYAEAAGREVAK